MTRPTPLAPHTPEAFAALVCTQAQAFRRTSPDDLAQLTLGALGVCLALALQDAPPGTPSGKTIIEVCQSLTSTPNGKDTRE